MDRMASVKFEMAAFKLSSLEHSQKKVFREDDATAEIRARSHLLIALGPETEI